MTENCGISSDAPSLRESPAFGPNDPAALACLNAAKGLGLIARYARGVCKHSRSHPDLGWWGRKSYGASMDLGGPWSTEFVGRMCELGLLSINPQSGSDLLITKVGRALLKAQKAPASESNRKDGSSPSNSPSPTPEADQP